MRSYILTLILLSPLLLFGQKPQISFQRIGTEQGLSQSLVHCLLKDKEGFIWVGTQDGLNRFDGYTFRSFFSDKTKANSLSSSYIWTLSQSRDGAIWVGTNGGGLNRYSPQKESFTAYYPEADFEKANGENSVRSVFELNNGDLLVGSDAGVFYFNREEGKFNRLTLADDSSVPNRTIYKFHRLDDNNIMVGGFAKIFIYREQEGKLTEAKLSEEIRGGINQFISLANGQIWSGTGHGLIKLEYVAEIDSVRILERYLNQAADSTSISSDFAPTLYLSDYEGLWIGTNKGLNYLDLSSSTRRFHSYFFDPKDATSISSNLIYNLIEVEDGILWAATQNGINQFKIEPPLFKSIGLLADDCGNSLHGLSQLSNKELLACTEKGLVILDLEQQGDNISAASCYNQVQVPDIGDEFLVSITAGQDDHYWLAFRRGGYGKVEANDQELNWQNFKLPAGTGNIGTNYILEEPSGEIWIASSGFGLWKYNPASDQFQSYQKSDDGLAGNYIFTLHKDSKEQLWIGTADGGLSQMDPISEKFQSYKHDPNDPSSLSNNLVLSIFEDSQKRIWVCTADGLNLLQGDGSFLRFYQKDGLPNNLIYGILEDNANYLWISTNQGICRLQYEDGLLDTKSFNTEDGLLKNEFNQHSFLKLENGFLAFGTQGGLNIIDPKKIGEYLYQPKVVLTDFKLFNESVPISSKEQKNKLELKDHINYNTEIVLKHNQNFIAFEFSGINFEQAKYNEYAYQMEGLDQDWVYCGQRRYANYPDLDPGSYTFKVKVANHDGYWSSQEKIIQLRVLSPPWQTWWAYLLYLIAASLIIYSIFQYRLRTLRLIEETKEVERRQLRKRSARDFHDEAGNQITRISLITEIAKREASNQPSLQNMLEQIEENVQDLRSGMRDFIWVLDPGNDNLYETLSRLKSFANNIFEFSPIHFSTIGVDESLSNITLNGDVRRQLLLIFKEAINNCLKYSQAEKAWLEVSVEGDVLHLKFSDDGIGFDLAKTVAGNGLANIAARAQKIGAEHVLKSTPSQGTSLRLHLNIAQMGN